MKQYVVQAGQQLIIRCKHECVNDQRQAANQASVASLFSGVKYVRGDTKSAQVFANLCGCIILILQFYIAPESIAFLLGALHACASSS